MRPATRTGVSGRSPPRCSGVVESGRYQLHSAKIMPSTLQINVDSQSDRPTYPDIAAEFGEDPARFLDNPTGDGVPGLAFARIRGIESLDLLRKWFAVETDLGPRRDAIAALNQRQRQLEQSDQTATPEVATA